MKALRLTLAALAVAVLANAPARVEAGFTQMVVFGDSLTDAGNAAIASGGKFPPSPPYYQGHFSNGPIWIEDVAKALGLPAPAPSLLHGTVFSYGGAETGLTGNSVQGTPNMGTQVTTYLAANTPEPGGLNVLWGGGNDFLNAGQTNPLIPVQNIAAELTSLANAGAKNFLVANLPDLGKVPGVSGQSQAVRDGLTALTNGFNAALSATLDNLQTSLGVTIYRLDIHTLLEAVQKNPSAYGFVNATDSALAALATNPSLDPNTYLFWDSVHPTLAAGQLIANLALIAVPEPSSMTLVLVAGCVGVVPGLRVLRWRLDRKAA